MAYTSITRSDIDPGKPIKSATANLIADDLDDLDSRLTAVSAFGDNAIIDDFIGATGTSGIGSWWQVESTGGEEPTVNSEHQARCFTAAAADYSALGAAASRIRIDLTQEYQAVFQCRVYKAAGTDDNFFFGWQDSSLTGSNAVISTNQNRIGFYRDSAAAAWVFETVNNGGGGGAATSTTGVGTSTSWGVYKITVTCSATAGNRQIVVEAGTTEANLTPISGSPFTNATGDLPTTVSLRPVVGVHRAGATNLDLRVDYVLAYTVGRPLAA